MSTLSNQTTAMPPAVIPVVVTYGRQMEEEIEILECELLLSPAVQERFPSRWLAIKLLEQDSDIQSKLLEIDGGHERVIG